MGMNDGRFVPKSMLMRYVDEDSINYSGANGRAWMVLSYAWYPGRKNGAMSEKQGEVRIAKMKKFVEDNKLGTFTVMEETQLNGHMDNQTRIRAMIWVPDNKAIHKFVVEKKSWRKLDAFTCTRGLNW